MVYECVLFYKSRYYYKNRIIFRLKIVKREDIEIIYGNRIFDEIDMGMVYLLWWLFLY